MKKLIIVIVLFLILFNETEAQKIRGGLEGIYNANLYTYYSDDIQIFQNYLSTRSEILNNFRYHIPDIIIDDSGFENSDDIVNVTFHFDIFKNHEETSSNQYFGAIRIDIRKFTLDNIWKDLVWTTVYLEIAYLVYTNPTPQMIESDSEQIISGLITSLAAKYYQQNSK